MIVEELSLNELPDTSIPKGTTLKLIFKAIQDTTPFFISGISKIKKKLNEEELTQEFVAHLRRNSGEFPFCVGQEKKDIYKLAKGKPDIYFYSKEVADTTESIFDLEAKRLPPPKDKRREKEYVVGEGVKATGGLQRFKRELHGKGLTNCGMLAFIEQQNPLFWKSQINKWISDLCQTDNEWSLDELLDEILQKDKFTYLVSNLKKVSNQNSNMHHFWIDIK